jgi:60S ribosome subunit biogenesis protein NIP7
VKCIFIGWIVPITLSVICLQSNYILDRMRPLTDEETEKLFSKLAKYIGDNIKLLLENDDRTYCFRLHRDRIYYADEQMMRTAAGKLVFSCCLYQIYLVIGRKDLISFGTCLGKFTKGGKFFLHITALEYLAPYAKVI